MSGDVLIFCNLQPTGGLYTDVLSATQPSKRVTDTSDGADEKRFGARDAFFRRPIG